MNTGTSNTSKTRYVHGLLVSLKLYNHIPFQNSTNIKNALNAVSILQPTEQNGEPFHYRVTSLLQCPPFIPVQAFTVYLTHQPGSFIPGTVNHSDMHSHGFWNSSADEMLCKFT